MGFWSDRVLPRLIDKGMRNDFMAQHRCRAAPYAAGQVLEIGFGSGLNLPHYTDKVERVFGLEPSAYLREQADELIRDARLPVELLDAGAENIPLESHSIDCVISSWTLCSVPDIERSLQELRRVLKPGGRFVFIEHGRSPEASLARWQDRLVPVSTRLLGCDLSRPIDTLVSAAGFRFTALEHEYIEGPRLISYHYVGQAQAI